MKTLFSVFAVGIGMTVLCNQSFALDTSGCSGIEPSSQRESAVEVMANKAPRRDCWNLQQSGVRAIYRWQQSEREPNKKNIGFSIGLNNQFVYAKANYYNCMVNHEMGYGKDTSGINTYSCIATANFTFETFPGLLRNAYNGNTQNAWDVRVAVSLDDYGNWDSRDGSDYRFRF